MIRGITSARGKPAIEDINHYRYTANGEIIKYQGFFVRTEGAKPH